MFSKGRITYWLDESKIEAFAKAGRLVQPITVVHYFDVAPDPVVTKAIQSPNINIREIASIIHNTRQPVRRYD